MVFDKWRARRQHKADAESAREQRLRVISQVKHAVDAADPSRVRVAAAGMLSDAIAGDPGRTLTTSLHGTAPSALAELGDGLTQTTPMDADAADQLYIAVDRGWDATSEPSRLLEAIENWVEYLREPTASAAASVLWLCVLAHQDQSAALADVRQRLGAD